MCLDFHGWSIGGTVVFCRRLFTTKGVLNAQSQGYRTFFFGSPLCRLARSIDEKQTATLEKYNNNSVWNWNCVVPTVVTFEGICVSIGEKKWFHDVIRCLLLSFLRGPTRFSKADKYVPNNFFYSSSEKFDISPTRLTEIPPIIRHSLPLKSAFKK